MRLPVTDASQTQPKTCGCTASAGHLEPNSNMFHCSSRAAWAHGLALADVLSMLTLRWLVKCWALRCGGYGGESDLAKPAVTGPLGPLSECLFQGPLVAGLKESKRATHLGKPAMNKICFKTSRASGDVQVPLGLQRL